MPFSSPTDVQLLRCSTGAAVPVVPDTQIRVDSGKEGRPMGAAYGRPFRRPGPIESCAHNRCWEPTPFAMPGTEGSRATGGFGEGTVIALLRPGAARGITNYTPQLAAERWKPIRPFVQDAVAVIAPACEYLAERLMVVTTGLVDWLVNVLGYPMLPHVIFNPILIRKYISRDDSEWEDKTRRDYRSLLLRISEVAVPDAAPAEFGALNGQSVTAPYTMLELALLESWARGQASAFRRRSAGVLLALAAGAGLDAWEVQHARRRDIRIEGGTAVVSVDGAVPRTSVVQERWTQLLVDSMRDVVSDEWVFGGAGRTTTFNVVTSFIRKSDRGAEPNPMPTRMRATWLASHLAARTPADVLMRAAGMTKAEHLATSLLHIPAFNTTEHRQRVLAEARRKRQSTR